MKQIPVWRTIGAAYGFAFENLATIVGFVWLPLVLLFAGEYFAVSHYFDAVLAALASGNRVALNGGLAGLLVFRMFALLIEAVIAVPVMRFALGLGTRPKAFHFALGPAELRLFAGLVAISIVVQLVSLPGQIALRLLAGHRADLAAAVPPFLGISPVACAQIGVLACTGFWALFVAYVGVRLSFFVAAVIVAEKKLDLVTAWSLLRGNNWRSLFVVLAVGAPVWLVYLAIQISLVGSAIYLPATDIVLPVASQFAAGLAASQMHRILHWLPLVYAIWFAIEPLALGLMSGAAAAAYRALVPAPPAVSTPPADLPLAMAAR